MSLKHNTIHTDAMNGIKFSYIVDHSVKIFSIVVTIMDPIWLSPLPPKDVNPIAN